LRGEIVDESIIYDGWLKLYKRRIDGKQYEIIKNYDAVAALVINEKNDVLLVKQYRPSIMKETLEIPAGVIDILGETKEECIVRELKEETGLDILIGNIEKIVSYRPQMGFSASIISIFKVRIKSEDLKSNLVNDKDVTRVQWVSFDSLKSSIEKGDITDSKTIMSYYYLNSKQDLI